MAQELELTSEETAALDQIDAALKSLNVRGTTTDKSVAFTSIDPADLCKKYQAIKAYLKILVKLIRKIPMIGDKAADAIEFLMGLADIACPV